MEVEAGGSVSALSAGPEAFDYRASLTEESVVTVNVLYFPGWKVYADGREMDFKLTPKGLMEFSLPPGEHLVQATFEDTAVRRVSEWASLGGLLGLLWLAGSALFFDRRG